MAEAGLTHSTGCIVTDVSDARKKEEGALREADLPSSFGWDPGGGDMETETCRVSYPGDWWEWASQANT